MPGVTVDGMDINAVVAAAEEAVAYVRAGNGPYFLETATYRFRGHYGGDPEHTYRSKEEVLQWRIKDPIARAKAELVGLGVADGELAKMEKTIVDSLKADQEWALAQPFPTVEQATDHVMIPLT